MEEKRRDSIGTPPPPASTADAPTSEQPTSRRRGGAQKRKSASVNSGGSGSASQTTSSKRQAREKPPPVPFPPIHMNGPCTRARVQPYNSSSAYAEVAAVKSEAEAREAAAKMEEMIRANENWQALEAKIEADYAAIRSRDASVHVVPFHAGWFSWTKIHPLEEMMLPSFFNGKLESRTPQIYMDIRNWIMMKFHVNLSEQIELKHLSEITVGELDARQEVMEFLEYWGLINYHPFPKHESSNMTVDADADKDEAQKIDSLVEKLYKFETVQSWTPIIPRTNMTVPATSSGVFPESVVADELVRSEEPPVEYHCNSCSADCSRKRYHCQKQADFDLCADCFTSGKFGSDMSPSDFILMEPGEAGGAGGGNWTDQETLLLLEAIELFRDNWSEIAEHVATKTRAQCILHFVQMPIEDVFFNHDDEADDAPKESEALVSISENSAPKTDEDSSITVKEAPQKTESREGTTDNQDSSCPIPTSKPDEGNALEKSPDAGENLALKALKEAFEAVGSFPLPGEKLCFAEAGNPVMALAAYLVRLVDPNVATAAVHSVLKSLSGNSSSEELAARHCFRLEDPPDDIKNLITLEGTATETSEHKAGNKGKQGENQEETPELVVNVNGSHDETDAKKDSAPVERGEKENSTSKQKPLSAPSSNHADKSNTMKESGELATHKKAESISSKSPKEQALKDNEDSVVSVSNTKSQSKPVKESEGGASADEVGKSNENQKDENMTAAPEKTGADLLAKSTSMTEKENLADDGEAKKCADEKKETQVTKDNLEFEKLKNAAVTALSGAAVKAKFLADEEEEEILKLTTYIIEKQLYKLETKMAFFQDMDNVLMRVKEQLDRSKQKLFHERAQIIASRFGMSGSARPSPNAPGVPPNRPPFNFPNSAPRPAMGVNSLRPPFPRPMTPPNPTSTTTTSATSVQQPN